jgi:hypothetical protein
MKMVKSLLLSSAAGVVAVAGAQAADLPVKAKPVEYVKICSLYGDGFYYIPGTDICIRVGGYIMDDYYWNGQGAGANQPIYLTANASFDRTTSQWDTKTRANVQMDTRMQTAYGTLRTFTSLHFTNGSVVDTENLQRAFIQFAGFTFGRTVSFSDTPGDQSDAGFQSIVQYQLNSNTGANGVNQIAYTWEIGNGMTLTGGADERRTKSVFNAGGGAAWSVGSDPATTRNGNELPDPYLAFKVNQAWGQFGVSGIAHNDSATYYGAGPGIIGYAPTAACVAQSGTTFCTHPEDKWGWAIQGGVFINTPGGNGNQDHIGGNAHFGIGATGYGIGNNVNSAVIFGGGNQLALGASTDTVYVNGSQQEQTTSWAVQGGYEHWWVANFRTSIFGGYGRVEYNDTVVNSRWFCGGAAGNTAAIPVQNVVVGAATRCDPGFNLVQVGARADWYPVKQLRFGLEGSWLGVGTAFNNQLVTLTKAIGNRPTGVYVAKNEGVATFVFRARKDF